MPEPVEILRTIASEYDSLAESRTHMARMADGNAERPHLPTADVERQRQLGAKYRQDADHFQARAAAVRAGVEAMEARRG